MRPKPYMIKFLIKLADKFLKVVSKHAPLKKKTLRKNEILLMSVFKGPE